MGRPKKVNVGETIIPALEAAQKVIAETPDATAPETVKEVAVETPSTITPDPTKPISDSDRIASLEEQLATALKMIRSTADAGRLMNFDAQQNLGKKPMKVKLSEYGGGIIVGWRTIKDIAVYHPTTGKQVGEEYQIELLIQDDLGNITKQVLNSIPAFTDARYAKRIEATVVGKKEDANGNLSYDLELPGGRHLNLASQYVN